MLQFIQTLTSVHGKGDTYMHDTDNVNIIPKIVHRTVPKDRTELMNRCWDSVLLHTPDWEHMTHEDDGDYEIVGPYLHLCEKGAFRGDLIRLEALYKYGGIYLDSDIELYRELDPLLKNELFISQEDDVYMVNVAIGTFPKNKTILEMIDLSIDILKSGTFNFPYMIEENKHFNGKVAFGPYVAHNIALKYSNTYRLPSKAFYLFSGRPPENEIDIDILKSDKDVYGRHLYAASWL